MLDRKKVMLDMELEGHPMVDSVSISFYAGSPIVSVCGLDDDLDCYMHFNSIDDFVSYLKLNYDV